MGERPGGSRAAGTQPSGQLVRASPCRGIDAPPWDPAHRAPRALATSPVLYRMGGRVGVADTAASRPAAQRRVERETTSDGYPIVPVSAYDAPDVVWWARACARDSASVRQGEFLSGADVGALRLRRPQDPWCRVRASGDGSVGDPLDDRSRDRTPGRSRRVCGTPLRGNPATGAWWAPTPQQPTEPTADEWAVHAAQLRARAGR
jgi:hypothetical protein